MIAANPSDFGNQLRLRRRELGVSQQELADVIGVNRRVVGEVERGKGTARLGIALAMAQTLGLDLRLEPRGR